MVMKSIAFGAAAGLMMASVPASAGKPDQEAALEAVRSGRAQSLSVLSRRVVPQVRGNYMGGGEYYPSSNTYRMKFMRGNSVIWVDVDGRSGRIIGRSDE